MALPYPQVALICARIVLNWLSGGGILPAQATRRVLQAVKSARKRHALQMRMLTPTSIVQFHVVSAPQLTHLFAALFHCSGCSVE